MQQCITLQKGFSGNTSLKDALDFLANRWKLDITVDADRFRRKGVPAVQDAPVNLPKLVDIRLGQVLTLLADQVNGACLTWQDRVVLVPRSSVGGMKGIGYKPFTAVSAKDEAELRAKLEKPITLAKGFDAKTPFKGALESLANHCQLNILVEETNVKGKARREFERSRVCLPDIEQLPIGDVLQKICAQANSSYRIQGRIIWIAVNQPKAAVQ
jgi:hypothetical protein